MNTDADLEALLQSNREHVCVPFEDDVPDKISDWTTEQERADLVMWMKQTRKMLFRAIKAVENDESMYEVRLFGGDLEEALTIFAGAKVTFDAARSADYERRTKEERARRQTPEWETGERKRLEDLRDTGYVIVERY